MGDRTTIIAQASGRGPGAIALVRLSGPDAITIADAMAHIVPSKKLADQPSHTIHYGYVVNHDGSHIDQVLFLVMRAPRTFTGQDTVEITCHNNQFIIESIIQRARVCGARVAQSGEFTQRAVEHGKIDIAQAEGINELIHASSQQAIIKSLAQVEGSLSALVEDIQEQLLYCRALCEASFEFIEEDVDFVPQIRSILTKVGETIAQLTTSFSADKHIREGVRIALIGSVNVGKSSLFNKLLEKDRAIVTDIAGTTRDVIEAGLYRNGLFWTVVDTAGIRQTDDIIEQAGIERSYQEADKADVVLIVFDATTMSAALHEQYKKLYERFSHKTILVSSKSDLQQDVVGCPIFPQSYKTSVYDLTTIQHLLAVIDDRVAQLLQQHSSPFLINKRHFDILQSLQAKLIDLEPLLEGDVAYELLSIHLQELLQDIGNLTGKTVSEETMNTIFRSFCIGK